MIVGERNDLPCSGKFSSTAVYFFHIPYHSGKSRTVSSQSNVKFLVIKKHHSDEILISASKLFLSLELDVESSI